MGNVNVNCVVRIVIESVAQFICQLFHDIITVDCSVDWNGNILSFHFLSSSTFLFSEVRAQVLHEQ